MVRTIQKICEETFYIVIGQLMKKETTIGTEGKTNIKIKQGFLWALGHDATHQITRFEYPSEPVENIIEKIISTYIYLD